MRFLTALLTLAVFSFSLPAFANDAADIRAAQSYLQSLDTAKARFVQTTNDGRQLSGTFYMDRPGKLRFEYDPPVEDFVVADGVLIYFYDSELGEQTHAPIGTTLADFFLQKNIDLYDEELKITSVKRAGGFLQIELVQSDDPQAGSLTLGFKEDPFQLKKWRVVDGQGLITEVELFYLETGLKLDRYLFVYADPDFGKGSLND